MKNRISINGEKMVCTRLQVINIVPWSRWGTWWYSYRASGSGSIPISVAQATVWSGRPSCSLSAALSGSLWPGQSLSPPAVGWNINTSVLFYGPSSFHPVQLVCPVGGILITSYFLSLLTSKLILAVNGSSSLSSNSSPLHKTCSSDLSELRTAEAILSHSTYFRLF